MATVRKKHSKLTTGEWDALVAAIDAIRKPSAAKPTYADFVKVHIDAMDGPGMHVWGVHSMPGMRGRNFLAWHRWYLLKFEERLRAEDPGVSVPYWDWEADPKIPTPINKTADLQRWGVLREWDPDVMPERPDVKGALRRERFEAFQTRLESVHGWVHSAVGGESGQMSTSRSPEDPIFWLHHANIDRIWAHWQTDNPRKRPKNVDEVLRPNSLFGVKVAATQNLSKLRVSYA